MAFVAVSFLHADSKGQFRQFFSSPLLWGMSLLFFIPLLTGLWSNDKTQWLAILQIKLPLLFLPLAFAGPMPFSKKQWYWVAYFFIALITGATLCCVINYIPDAASVNVGYLKAKSMITPLENDHVRFSWMVSVSILLAGWIWIREREKQKIRTWILLIVTIWLIIFLHILAARTGLFSFYIIVLMLAFWLVLKKIKWQYGIALLFLLILLPVTAYFTIPTFHNRVKYIVYEFDYFKQANYQPGSNDGMRIISLKAGWNSMQQQPVTGVGFGDIGTGSKQWYSANYPQMIEADKILPSSEWMMYGAGAGIPGIILFTAIMLIPFFIAIKNKLLWWMLNETAAFSFLFDIGLEVQFGVFIYAFIVLWWWKWLKTEKI